MSGSGLSESAERDDSPAEDKEDNWIVVGRISGIFGVRGWLKVYSHTAQKSSILGYKSWYLQRAGKWQAVELESGREHGKGIVAKLIGCDDRDSAAALQGVDIAIPRDQLPAAGKDEFYWMDLEGLQVNTIDGVNLGRVDHLFETGANDVIVVEGERRRLLPFISSVVIDVDLDAGVISVDWDPDF